MHATRDFVNIVLMCPEIEARFGVSNHSVADLGFEREYDIAKTSTHASVRSLRIEVVERLPG